MKNPHAVAPRCELEQVKAERDVALRGWEAAAAERDTAQKALQETRERLAQAEGLAKKETRQMTDTTIIQTQPERALLFDSKLAPYINWDSIAQTARELGAHFEARYDNSGACIVTFFWSY